jgi:hypothetical protein
MIVGQSDHPVKAYFLRGDRDTEKRGRRRFAG